MTTARPRTATVAMCSAGFLLVFTLWLVGRWSHGHVLTTVDDVLIVVVSLVALAFSVFAARASQGRHRAAWFAMVWALVAWNVSEIMWTYDELILHEVAFPSMADVFFMLYPVGACVAMVLFWNGHGRRSRGLILLDGLIVAGSLFIVSWVLVMAGLYEKGAATRLEFSLALAYPVSDLVVVTVAAAVLVSAPPGQRVVMTLLTVGLICMAIADSGYAFLSAQGKYVTGALIDVGWVAGLLLLTVAAAAARDAPTEEPSHSELPGWTSVWLPYAPLMFAGVVLTAKPPTAPGPLLVTVPLLGLTVLARQYLSMQENRRLLAAVSEQALRDPLTGLGNRALFSDRLQHALRLRDRAGSTVAVLILDLDDFKLINDTLGHAAGDELLKRAGLRIANSVRPGDTVARLGGDEFAVIIEEEPVAPEATALRLIQAFERPVTVEGQELSMWPSIGLAVAAPGQPDVSAEELLKQADLAMYAAKRSRSSVRRFSGDVRSPDYEATELLADLRRAVDRREFSLVYQPKYALSDGAVVGVEALLRWPHTERGVLTPDEFLPLVRRHGLIEPVTQFVIDTALDDARVWWAAGLHLPVAVNLFPPSLAAPQLPDRLDRALSARGLDSSALTVEITEDVLLHDIERIRTVLGELRERGISVAIDDFGSGYSALWYLRDLAVDEVKLDRGFIAPIADDPRAGAVARAVIDLAHVLLMKTVAEGVENLETANWLRRHGCDIVQGYYFSPPLTAAEVLSLRGSVAVKSS